MNKIRWNPLDFIIQIFSALQPLKLKSYIYIIACLMWLLPFNDRSQTCNTINDPQAFDLPHTNNGQPYLHLQWFRITASMKMTWPKLQIRAHKPKNKRTRHHCFQRTSSVRVEATVTSCDRKKFVNPSENETRYRLSCNLAANTKAKEVVT